MIAAVVGAGPLATAIATALHDAGIDVQDGAGGDGPLDALVFAPWDPAVCTPVPFNQLTDDDWQASWQNTMDAAVETLVATRPRMVPAGGRVVLTVPTTAMAGGAGYAHWAAAAEGVRVLAKSVARQWGHDGITVNVVAVSPELVLADPAHAGPVSLAPAALDGTDPAALIVLLCTTAAGVTGQTITADGGLWMV